MEIERKFLVPQTPELGDAEPDSIEQGYLTGGPDGEVRLRRKGGTSLLTAKRGEGLSREEAEIEISAEQFHALWPLTEGRRLRKRRHTLPYEGHEIEVDLYQGHLDGLLVAEVEFDSEQEAGDFDPPGWFGEEVTGDDAYMNRTLATEGRPR